MTFDLDDLDLSKNKHLKLISGVALHLPSKFGEDRPKDLGGVGEQTNKQTDKRCSNYSMILRYTHAMIASRYQDQSYDSEIQPQFFR